MDIENKIKIEISRQGNYIIGVVSDNELKEYEIYGCGKSLEDAINHLLTEIKYPS